MCTGLDSTEESERMDVFSKEDFKQESNQNTDEVAEKIVTLGLFTTMLQAVEAASIIGKEGVHVVARALLMFPLEAPTPPETKQAIKEFIQQEAKRLVAGALAEQEAQSVLAGN